jgi:RNA polymerase sigma-70 factor (ECF subfamily)
MPFTPTRADTAALQRSADRVARHIVRHCRIAGHEREDLCQDLLTDLFARLKSFDSNRGELGAFAASCFEHRAIRLIARIRRSRAIMSPVSLDDPQPGGEGLTVGDTIAEAGGYAAWMGQLTDAFEAVERRIDLGRALGTLPAELLPLCAELTEHSPHELAKASPTSRATVYRQVRELRLCLLVAGIPARA